LDLIPDNVQAVYFGRGSLKEERKREIQVRVLDLFEDAYFNRHLLYGVMELLLVRLMPELAEKGVRELWEERLS